MLSIARHFIALCLVAQASFAAALPINGSFTGAITSSNNAALPFAIGDPVTGTFSYDSNAVPFGGLPGSDTMTYFADSYEVNASGHVFTGVVDIRLRITNRNPGTGPDGFHYFARASGPSFNNFVPADIQLSLSNADGAAFTSTALPPLPLDSAEFGFKLGTLNFFLFGNGALGSARAEFNITSLTLPSVAAVPEPATYALMLAGLGIVGFAARRRRKANTTAVA